MCSPLFAWCIEAEEQTGPSKVMNDAYQLQPHKYYDTDLITDLVTSPILRVAE